MYIYSFNKIVHVVVRLGKCTVSCTTRFSNLKITSCVMDRAYETVVCWWIRWTIYISIFLFYFYETVLKINHKLKTTPLRNLLFKQSKHSTTFYENFVIVHDTLSWLFHNFLFFLPVFIKHGTIMYGQYYGVNLSIYEYENMSECGFEGWQYCE
jgi:hypothetical protein